MDLLTAATSGMLAGLGVALPLGAISVLLLGEGVAQGFRAGAPAALAVGTVDTLYCAVAVAIGGVAAPVITGWGVWPAVFGGAALVTIAALGLRRSLARPATGGDPATTATTASATPAPNRGGRRYALFLGLTAINPTTLIYFAAITVGLASVLRSPLAALVFVVGAGLASLAWQLLLVAAGAQLGGRATPRARWITTVTGNVIVAGLGVAMIVVATL